MFYKTVATFYGAQQTRKIPAQGKATESHMYHAISWLVNDKLFYIIQFRFWPGAIKP